MDRAYIDAVSKLAENIISQRDEWMDKHGFDYELYEKLCESGLYGLTLPKEYGGLAADAESSMEILSILSASSASVSFSIAAHWLAAGMVLQHGNETQKNLYLPQAAKGKIFAFGLTEESAGSDAAGIRSVATPTENGWLINGDKLWITNSGVADYYIILVKTDTDAGTHGISAFVVPKDTEGLYVGEFERKMGMRGATTCKLRFENMLLPHDAVLGKLGDGFKYAMSALDSARISIAYQAIGISKHAMNIAFDYANSRKTFGLPIAEHQAIQFSAAEMHMRLTAAKLFAREALSKKSAGGRYTAEAAAAKLYASEACSYICNKAIQFLGGKGYSEDYHAERLLRDARVLEIAEGTSEILRMVIGKTALKQNKNKA